ncbi:MAG: endonuclease/exonuclease/phosphatase family protein [Chloroflexota bacterium]|nr:MAG: endonuclease/exonuclease/phosphatase family protein [Chloroflexota bacterium]
MPYRYQIAFWNLENLFDIEDSPRRNDKLQRAIGDDLEGWTQALLDRKVSQLASIIRQMNDGHGPDILGVCEVENEYVMNLLVQNLAPLGRSYAVAHHDTPDQRGIDVGFIYDANLFNADKKFSHFVMRRTATRDILQVNFLTTTNRIFVVVGNHWPSRSGGAPIASAGYRAIAAETLAYFHQRILEVLGAETPVLAMGDFNDEPFDSSLVDYALSTRSRTKMVNAKVSRFFNLMWPIMGQELGTYYYNNFPNVLDQFLANKNLMKGNAPIRVLPDSVQIIRFPEMIDTGEYPKPIPFGGMGKQVNNDGFSDHFPIAVTVVEQD